MTSHDAELPGAGRRSLTAAAMGRGSWLRSPGKYLLIGRTSARSNLAYPGEVLSRCIFLGVVLYIFLQLWRVTYAGTGAHRLGGLTLAQMLWYLAMTEAITLSAPRVSQEVDSDVRTGSLAVQLIRPLPYPLYRLSATLGDRLVRFGMNALIGSVLVSIFVGPLHFTPYGLAIFAISVPFAFVLDFLAMFTIGLGAFWLEDTSGITLIYSRLAMILGGMLIPLELFPAKLQPALRILPFSSVVYGPARLLVRPDARFLEDLLLRQGITIVVLAAAAAGVYRAALRRVHANGG